MDFFNTTTIECLDDQFPLNCDIGLIPMLRLGINLTNKAA